MLRPIIPLFLLFLLACSSSVEITKEEQKGILKQRGSWDNLVQQLLIDELLISLAEELKPQAIIFNNVRLITMNDSLVTENISVVVQDGIITAIGNINNSAYPGALIINANGKYLMPGLTDAHVHVGESNDEKLLNLAAGVTTVRDMCGFDWMHEYRRRIKQNQIFAPNIYYTGTMLNFYDIGIYSEVVKTEIEARQKIQRQKRQGYDFIKVWNNMPLEILKAIDDECQKQAIDLVCHIPHGTKLEDMLSLHAKTIEHMKGYILDRTLEITNENYVQLSDKLNFWQCPTFSLRLQGLKNEEGINFIKNAPEMQYVPQLKKQQWVAAAKDTSLGKFGNVPARVDSMQRKIFIELLRRGKTNFIAGTDNNGENINMVAGFVLYHELEEMSKRGLSNYNVLKTATINAAKAMGKETEYGTISIGKRADLILLEKNPLENISNIRAGKGVMIRGIWLSKEKIGSILNRIIEIYATAKLDESKVGKTLDLLMKHYTDSSRKYLIKPSSLILFGKLLAESGLSQKAISILQYNIRQYPAYDAHDALGTVYLSLGDTTSALREFRVSLHLYKYNDATSELIKKLDLKGESKK